MAELRPIPIDQLLHRILVEPARQGTLFDLPLRKTWRPNPAVDLSVDVHGERAQSPIGPAAGPHAQMAQNIILSWLGGSRIIELKTVQVLDRLKIPRPCIDAATVGFNVEWSQEMTLAESLEEYAAGWLLLRILRELDPLGLGEDLARAADPVFELSVGYDLAGLKSPSMRDYLARVKNIAPVVDELRMKIPPEHRSGDGRRLRDLDVRPAMVSCVTLSTFHGCPPGEIESIVRYLVDEHDVDVIVKLNPTLLGYEEVQSLLHDRLGFHDLRPKKSAFASDLEWDDAVVLARRLSAHAASRGRSFGVKMTNTLVVENHKKYFREQEMYLSGPPLHVLAMQCVDRWRAALGDRIPLSFSGGIDAHNVVDAVACDLVPVTTCTDLLRAGGYGRLPRYLENIEAAMIELRAPTREELILRRFGKGPDAVRRVFAELRDEHRRRAAEAPQAVEAAERKLAELEQQLLFAAEPAAAAPLSSVIAATQRKFAATQDGLAGPAAGLYARIVGAAGILNGHEVAARVTADARYGAGKNAKPPRKVGSSLQLYDCLSCDKCVPVCPNDANFVIETPPESLTVEDFLLDAGGAVARVPGAAYRVAEPRQWANFADACNECGNCDVFCPEDGGPYIVKPRFFGSLPSFLASPALDGLALDESEPTLRVRARLAGCAYELRLSDDGHAVLDDAHLRAVYDLGSGAVLRVEVKQPLPSDAAPHRLPGGVFPTLRTLLRGVLDPARVNPVNAALHRRWPSFASAPAD